MKELSSSGGKVLPGLSEHRACRSPSWAYRPVHHMHSSHGTCAPADMLHPVEVVPDPQQRIEAEVLGITRAARDPSRVTPESAAAFPSVIDSSQQTFTGFTG